MLLEMHYTLMGVRIPDEFLWFERHLVRLKMEWTTYNELYRDDANFQLFKRAGPTFWALNQYMLLDHVFLSIARLFDSDSMQGRQNLSLKYLVSLPWMEPIREEVTEVAKNLWPIYSQGLKLWRDRRISHNDLQTTLEAENLPPVILKDIDRLIEGLWRIPEIAHLHFGKVEISNEVHVIGGTNNMLYFLRKGVEKALEEGESLRDTQRRLSGEKI